MTEKLLGATKRLVENQKTANRSYQFLGVAHFLLIGGGLTVKALRAGESILVSTIAGFAMGVLFLAVFLHLADYHGNGSGDGRLVQR